MTVHPAPAQSFPVYDAEFLRVSNGANLGDAISFADEVVLDDVYTLAQQAATARLSLRVEGQGFVITPGSAVGDAGALVYADSTCTLMSPDGATTDVVVLVALDDTGHVARCFVLPLAPLVPKMDYTLVTIDTGSARARLAQAACVAFTRGTHITMASGAQVRIEDLAVGDKVLTRDAGAQAVRWIGQSTVRAAGEFAPICITAGALNNAHDLIVSPDHRLFIYQRSDRIGAGRSELLVKARHLVNGDTVRVLEGGFVDYFQLLFDAHHIIYAEGIAAESVLIDPRTAPALPEEMGASHLSNLTGLDVQETLLERPDATALLRRASRS